MKLVSSFTEGRGLSWEGHFGDTRGGRIWEDKKLTPWDSGKCSLIYGPSSVRRIQGVFGVDDRMPFVGLNYVKGASQHQAMSP